jgi:hypothetical protein
MDPDEPTTACEGLAILRVWREDETTDVRARLTTVDDVVPGEATAREWTGVGILAVTGEIRAWLERWSGSA